MWNAVEIKQVNGFGNECNIIKQQASTWTAYNAPDAGNTASTLKDGVSGSTYYVTSIMAASSEGGKYVDLYDGDNIIVRVLLGVAGVLACPFSSPIKITKGNTVRLRFSDTPSAGQFQSVCMTGYTV